MSAAARSSPPGCSKPQLVFFYSPRSGPARLVEGYLAQVLQRRANHDAFQLRRLDVDEHPAAARRFGITRLPTLVVIDDKKVKARLEAPANCAQIQAVLARWLR